MIVSEADFLRFCHLDEEHDPSEEFEEYLACSVCGDNGTCILMFKHVMRRNMERAAM